MKMQSKGKHSIWQNKNDPLEKKCVCVWEVYYKSNILENSSSFMEAVLT